MSLEGKVVLVTGGTGSFGKAFVKRILETENPKKVIVFSRDELKQYEMAQTISDDRIRFFIGDVRDRDRLYRAFSGVDVVIHAAALKQVPVAEYNPSEFVKTNILGTENVLSAAIDCSVQKVLVLSSDKASAPITAYGATKSVAEHLTRASQSYTVSTRFAALRYGNVAGSRGSVIPLWRSLASGGSLVLPITHSDMTRFFFTIANAVDFALWSLGVMEGGELFVPKMPSFRLTDLAQAFGLGYSVTGVRGIEKLAECMITKEESRYFREWENKYVRFREGKEKGSLLPESFEYVSDVNEHWLDTQDLEWMLESI